MSCANEQILRAAKEIVVKFIETGRVSPGSFPEVFDSVYNSVRKTVTQPGGTSAPKEGEGG